MLHSTSKAVVLITAWDRNVGTFALENIRFRGVTLKSDRTTGRTTGQ